MMTLVEKMQLAIMKTALESAAAKGGESGSEFAMAMARGALESIREPTFDMIVEGQKQVNLSREVGKYLFLSREEITEIWEAMVEYALLEAMR